jgi:signal transduction histidine kinase
MEKKILIVDDKQDNLVTLELILRHFDAEIILARSGQEALEKTLEHEFALALIDVQMPEMDGFEMVKLLRQVEKTKYLPVIFISAIYSEDQYLIQGIEAGAVDFIIKPLNPRILIGKVKVFLELYDQKKRLQQEILEKIKTQQSLVEAKRKAEESDQLKTAFLANMSHEIRTPLTTIVGFAGLLADDCISRDAKQEYVGYIYKSSEHLISLINDILDVAKIEAGQLRLEKSPVDLRILMNDIYQTFKNKLENSEKFHLTFTLNMPPETLVINTDEGRLRQVLENLLGNAIKFTTSGNIEFGYRVYEKDIKFYVNDTGIGIPHDNLKLIFERFRKIENGRAFNSSGTGLGLSIVKRLVEILGGDIEVVSKLNQGSSFSFTLPKDISQPEHTEPELRQAAPDKPDWSSKNILVVEDEFSTYVLLESWLLPTGAKLQWAKNGHEALATINENIDAVLMDINMPEMSGVEAFHELRKVNQTIPVIAQTAYAMADEKEQLTGMGFNGYITKPIAKNDLLQVLNLFL